MHEKPKLSAEELIQQLEKRTDLREKINAA
jgi:hypothetical protein